MIDILIRFAGLTSIFFLSTLIVMMLQDAFGVVRNGLEDDDDFDEDED